MNIEIRQFQPRDFDGVMALVQTCYGETAEPPEWWRWRHFELDPGDSTMFVAAHGDKLVGMRPLSLFNYFMYGQPLRGALFSAVMVHPDYRRLGIFSRLVKACSEEAWRRGAAFINTMPNDISYLGFKKLGWQDPGERMPFIRPLNIEGLARQKINPSWLGATLGFLGHGLVRLILPRPRPHPLEIATVPGFDPEAEVLSQQIGAGYQGLILHRTHTWLTWRYKANPWNRYTRFEARSAATGLQGYAITNMNHQKGVAVGYLVDLLGYGAEVRQALIKSAMEHLQGQGAQLGLAVISSPELARDLRRQGFFAVPAWLSPKKFYTVFQPHPDHQEAFAAVSSIERWYQTLGDWDGI
jgi:GNAT superfamily N-acetyltransferase